jgi:hypothetical protein
VALKEHQCGSGKVSYDDSCTFQCTCTKASCSWSITCNGKVRGSGTEKPRVRPKTDTIFVDGLLRDIANALEEQWGRRVIVPRGMAKQRITKRARGEPEQIVKALGLKLGQ